MKLLGKRKILKQSEKKRMQAEGFLEATKDPQATQGFRIMAARTAAKLIWEATQLEKEGK